MYFFPWTIDAAEDRNLTRDLLGPVLDSWPPPYCSTRLLWSKRVLLSLGDVDQSIARRSPLFARPERELPLLIVRKRSRRKPFDEFEAMILMYYASGAHRANRSLWERRGWPTGAMTESDSDATEACDANE
jgi:hypothetical protein